MGQWLRANETCDIKIAILNEMINYSPQGFLISRDWFLRMLSDVVEYYGSMFRNAAERHDVMDKMHMKFITQLPSCHGTQEQDMSV